MDNCKDMGNDSKLDLHIDVNGCLPKNMHHVIRSVLQYKFLTIDSDLPFSIFCSIMKKMTPYGIICR